MLEAKALDVAIGGRTVCRRVDFALRGGEQLAILGRNGAGKSTLLATLAGLRASDHGSIRLCGGDLASMPLRDIARMRGWLSQQHSDPFATTVLDTALAGRHPHLGRWDWESDDDLAVARDALRAVGLAGMEQRELQSLSGGERQRAAIATLLTQQPQLYLLDEPLAHLDLNHQIAVLDLFAARASCDGIATIMVLHDPGLAARYCDHALLLFGDGEWLMGPSSRVLTANNLSRLYGHTLREIRDDTGRWFVPS